MSTVRPIEIVVAPIKNSTGDLSLPLEALRAEFQRGLVERCYTPVALAHIDQNTSVEAGYHPGALGEQAVLDVNITGWDTSRWRSHASLVIAFDIFLLDATDPDPAKALWGGRATRTVDLSKERESYLSERDLLRRALNVAVRDTLASLPRRD